MIYFIYILFIYTLTHLTTVYNRVARQKNIYSIEYITYI